MTSTAATRSPNDPPTTPPSSSSPYNPLMPPPPPSPFRTDILRGQVAFITGGGSGIGYEITRQLGLHGATVVIMGRRTAVLKSAVAALTDAGITAASVSGDVRIDKDCALAIEFIRSKYERLDILINCAAGNFLAVAEDLSSKGFQTVMMIDAVGAFNASSAAFPLLKQSASAHHNVNIINISATLHKPATFYQVHASAAKAAVDSLTRSLALEWGGYYIRVNGIAPGAIAGTAGMSKLGGDAASQKKNPFIATIPLARMGTTADIALSCVFLCSTAADYVSGQTLTVDGANEVWRAPAMSRENVRSFAKAVEAKSRGEGVVASSSSSSSSPSSPTQKKSKL